MSADWKLPLVAAVIFLATLIRSAFGFGEALVAVPLLALLLPVGTAALAGSRMSRPCVGPRRRESGSADR